MVKKIQKEKEKWHKKEAPRYNESILSFSFQETPPCRINYSNAYKKWTDNHLQLNNDYNFRQNI